jgi:hypothetical protein
MCYHSNHRWQFLDEQWLNSFGPHLLELSVSQMGTFGARVWKNIDALVKCLS